MLSPRIGITCSPLRGLPYYAPYLRAIEAAGGEPVVLEPAESGLAAQDVEQLVSRFDGMLFPGGWDVGPHHYGQTREEATSEVDPALDSTEIALVRAAVDAGKPVLGICRGQQLINVALGGSLRQHIDGHDMHGYPRDLLAHYIDIDADSELAAATPGRTLMVNSLHHQSVKEVAPGLRATAHSADGVVEGVESPDGLVVAVQCHPEELIDGQGWALTLLRRFVDRVQASAERASRLHGS